MRSFLLTQLAISLIAPTGIFRRQTDITISTTVDNPSKHISKIEIFNNLNLPGIGKIDTSKASRSPGETSDILINNKIQEYISLLRNKAMSSATIPSPASRNRVEDLKHTEDLTKFVKAHLKNTFADISNDFDRLKKESVLLKNFIFMNSLVITGAPVSNYFELVYDHANLQWEALRIILITPKMEIPQDIAKVLKADTNIKESLEKLLKHRSEVIHAQSFQESKIKIERLQVNPLESNARKLPPVETAQIRKSQGGVSEKPAEKHIPVARVR
eukprot:NODE_502_length_7546_cov_0.138982.p2 type:complete len:273 gc:universal NODE_502_length_7546_cov_0.138982:2005-2823(+)